MLRKQRAREVIPPRKWNEFNRSWQIREDKYEVDLEMNDLPFLSTESISLGPIFDAVCQSIFEKVFIQCSFFGGIIGLSAGVSNGNRHQKLNFYR